MKHYFQHTSRTDASTVGQHAPHNGLRARLQVLVGLFLLLATFASASLPGSALAGNSGCRRDPIVFLSNGTVVRITVAIDTQVDNVREISYALHAPAGTSVERVIYTGRPNQPPERLTFYDDAAPGSYTTETVVYTHSNSVAVTATTRIGRATGSAAGTSGQVLTVQLHP